MRAIIDMGHMRDQHRLGSDEPLLMRNAHP